MYLFLSYRFLVELKNKYKNIKYMKIKNES